MYDCSLGAKVAKSRDSGSEEVATGWFPLHKRMTEQATDSRETEQQATKEAYNPLAAYTGAERAQKELERQMRVARGEEDAPEWRNPHTTKEAGDIISKVESREDLHALMENIGATPNRATKEELDSIVNQEDAATWMRKHSNQADLVSPYEERIKPEDVDEALKGATNSQQIADVMRRSGLARSHDV